ncbi:MAG TPA: shikimate kinase AroK [Gammaproteobacteria bacterium]|jgi:shikimate kinase|nr:shikimate kinase AroK [Chromatiales bacterium]MCP4926676.1 shikimate kinase AroK [Gammaproteobacteria bacterium]MDP7153782.1 shikimate kinase AroK [Gammaproteobacteria bacterium]MDP7661089.1 shikimate kinase AroK [Gammaproteobacteria bacterium]HJP37628.1 shikimate kinase AroK [Gammaproteobacteria bacterium]
MTIINNIFLIGPMGSGKTAVGRHLADDLGKLFVDSDALIEARTGVDIPFIFEKEGEAGFRHRETVVIEEQTQQDGIVLASGGGAILSDVNRRHLATRGFVIYLMASVQQQLVRTIHSKQRPLLNTGDREQILTDLFTLRDPLYREIADLCISTDNRTVARVAAEIRRHLERPGANPETENRDE